MNIKYNLHDSLIEQLVYDSINKKIFLKVDLCNWMQNDYEDDQPENLIINIIFKGVSYFDSEYLEYDFDSNEIIDVKYIDDYTIKIIFKTETDVNAFTITSESVEYQEDSI